MATVTTYSFKDLSGVITHPLIGSFTFTGQGIGEASVEMSTDKTVHDVAADGSVMVSYIPGENGQIALNAQQTSNLHKWLTNLYNLLKIGGNHIYWANMAIYLRNTADGTSHRAVGCSFQKMPNKPYQAQGQRVNWVIMAADIENLTA